MGLIGVLSYELAKGRGARERADMKTRMSGLSERRHYSVRTLWKRVL
jgi:hypothetical protein